MGTAAASYYPYGAVVQIPVTVSTGCSPDPIDNVVFTGTSPDYIANITVYGPRTINFTATAANYEVTVNTTNVTVISPTLVDGKYSSSSSSTIYFTMNDGTENLSVTVNGNSVTPTLISGSSYSLELTGISGATTVNISATLKTYAVSLTKNAYIASVSGLTEGSQSKEHGTVINNLTFTLTTGAHSPYVSINGTVVSATESAGTYSVPEFTITDASNITISAFAANVLPVSEDTYQRRKGQVSGFYKDLPSFESRGETAGYAAIPLLKFAPTEAMKNAGYHKAVLRMVPLTTVANLSYTVRQFPTTYENINVVPTNDYTVLMSANAVGASNQSVSFIANTVFELDVTDNYVLDFPDEIILSLIKGSNGTIHNLYSLENGNANYVPVLVFSEPNITLSDDETVVFSDAAFGNITVAAGKKLTVNPGVTLSGAKLILKSDENGTATFVNKGTATFETADVEQYLSTANGREWYYLASPVTTDHSNTVFGTGTQVGVYREDMHKYTNPVADTTLVAGTGYVVKLNTTNPTYTFSGTLNDGNISIPVSRTGTSQAKRGFNLVGNPYPSYLNWDDADKTNVMSTIWTRTYEGSAMVFKTYNADAKVGSDDETTARIAPLQAFWVKVPENKVDVEGLTLNFNNSQRSHKTNDDDYLRAPGLTQRNADKYTEDAMRQLLRLQISNGINSDNAVIVFDERASNSFDLYDSEKVSNDNDMVPEIYTLTEGTGSTIPLVINSVNDVAVGREFKLGFTTGVAGTFTIAASTLKNLENLSVILIDKKAGLQHDLATPYQFVSDIASTTERFSVVLQKKIPTQISTTNKKHIIAYSNGNRQIVIESADDLNQIKMAQIFNVAGQKLAEQKINTKTTLIQYCFTPGVYFVKIKDMTTKVIVK